MSDHPATRARLVAVVRGDVQGVGFRWWVRARARALGLAGSARNMWDGTVEVVAEGDVGACEQMVSALRGRSTPGTVSGVDVRWEPPLGMSGFDLG